MLHVALKCGFPDIANSALTAGANVNVADCDGDVPLHLAIKLHAFESKGGAHLASTPGMYHDLAMRLAAFGAGVNLDLKDRAHGDTALVLTMKYGFEVGNSCMCVYVRVLSIVPWQDLALELLNHGANPNLPSADWGRPSFARDFPVHFAIKTGQEQVARALILHDADIAVPDTSKNTVLHSCFEAGMLPLARLIAARLSNNRLGTDYRDEAPVSTPRISAGAGGAGAGAGAGAGSSGRRMGARSATPSSANAANRPSGTSILNEVCRGEPHASALFLCVGTGLYDMAIFLLEVCSRCKPAAARLLAHRCVNVQCGADPDIGNADGLTVLHRLALLSRVEDVGRDAMGFRYQMVLLLTRACLELRPDLTLKTKGRGLETSLHFACRLVAQTPFEDPAPGEAAVVMPEPDSCALEFARLLVTHNPGLVAARDDHLNTPLLLAAVQGSRAAVELMLDNGAYADAVNNKGNSPLHIACRLQYFPLLALLIERDAYRELWDDRVRGVESVMLLHCRRV